MNARSMRKAPRKKNPQRVRAMTTKNMGAFRMAMNQSRGDGVPRLHAVVVNAGGALTSLASAGTLNTGNVLVLTLSDN